MNNISIMIKPASSLCNLRCKYCFYTDVAQTRREASYGVMTLSILEKMLENIHHSLAPGDQIHFAFQGGEPSIAGLPFFEKFTALTQSWKEISVSYSFQTNATLLTDDWYQFFAKYNYLLGISLDCLPEQHDRSRVTKEGKGTYKIVLNHIRLLQKYKVDYNILCTLTAPIARHPQKVWSLLERMDFRYVQFTPCLADLNQQGKNLYALTPQLYADFYQYIFSQWAEQFQRGNYRSIKLFDDLVNLLAFGLPTSCGIDGHCQPQLIVESNGNVYPCDFYCLDEYLLGNMLTDDLHTLLKRSRASSSKNAENSLTLCCTCPYAHFCGGGCKRMRSCVCGDEQTNFCGQKTLLDEIMPTLTKIAIREKSLRDEQMLTPLQD